MEVHLNDILAYHIVWTTYGTWLPGDWRGWILKGASGIQPSDPEAERTARERMAEPRVLLNPDQRALVEQTIAEHCRIRGWLLHAVNARQPRSCGRDRGPRAGRCSRSIQGVVFEEALRCGRAKDGRRQKGSSAALVHRRRRLRVHSR